MGRLVGCPLSEAAGVTAINIVVVAELSKGFASLDALRHMMAKLGLVVEAMDETVAFLAGQRFLSYRRSRTDDTIQRVLPDFFIGAHASMLGCPLLTRDRRLYRSYFPDLTLITPETDA